MIRGVLLGLLATSLSSCHLFRDPEAAAATSMPTVAQDAPEPAGDSPPPVRRTTVERLTFYLDTTSSSGHIQTTLDPHGLGPRTAHCRCPLEGTLSGELTSRPDGSRSLHLDHIELATTRDGHLSYDWSPLIGRIQSVIPSGSLKISRKTIPGPFQLDSRGQFQRAGARFTVDGIANVVASGLLLKKQVGEQETDLSIDQTDAIHLVGSLIRRDGSWVLHVPAAILRDQFTLDDNGSTLDLNFTASILAVTE